MTVGSQMSYGPMAKIKSLHLPFKKKEAMRIDDENQKMIERIVNTRSVISLKHQDDDWARHQLLVKQLHAQSSQEQIQKIMKKKNEFQN